MDWSKAKTILIVVFLILNVFLLFTALYANSSHGFQDYARYAEEYLRQRNIEIDAKIPQITGQKGNIVYEARDFDFSQLTRYVFGHEVARTVTENSTVFAEDDNRIELTEDELMITSSLSDDSDRFKNSKAFLQMVYSFLDDIGYPQNNLTLQSSEETESTKAYVFNLKYKNDVLFDQFIRVDFQSDGLLTITVPAKEVKRVNHFNSDILSAYQVLVMGGLPDGSVVKDVSFGYKQMSKGELFDTPAWRFLLSDGTVYFFDAYTGEKPL